MSDGPGTLFVVSAPSGAGKSTLVARLLEAEPGLRFSVSWTTRAPRPGEQDGVHYHFRDEAAFRAKIAAGDLLEWAEVHGRLYGTGRAETLALLEAGIDVILDIDVQGAAQVRRSGLPAEFVFILPPDYATLERRLTSRATESDETLRRRLRNASLEVARHDEFDYVVINDDLARAADELIAIVRAARARGPRRADRVRRIVATFPGVLPGERREG